METKANQISFSFVFRKGRFVKTIELEGNDLINMCLRSEKKRRQKSMFALSPQMSFSYRKLLYKSQL